MIDKSLIPQPPMPEQDPSQEIPVGDDGVPVEFDVDVEDEEPEISLKDPVEFSAPIEDDFNINLADKLDEDDLDSISSMLLDAIEDDDSSRKEHQQMYIDGLELLGMKLDERNDPWPGACGVFHPLLTEALVKFQAETMMETFPAAGPVKTEIIGKETAEKKAAAFRVQADMNHQLVDEMLEYRPEHEKMLWGLGLAGNAFKKVYYDPILGRQASIFIPESDLIVPYGATSLMTAERVTHVMRKTEEELMRMQVSGFYRDVEMPEPSMDTEDEIHKKIAEQQGFSPTNDERYCIYECHCYIDVPGYEDKSGLPLPYIVTLEKDTGIILAIRRNWKPSDKSRLKKSHFVHYPYVPGFGFYAFGLIHLVGAFAKSSTAIIRQLIDAGTLANLPAGFKARGIKNKNDDTPMKPGEWRDIDVAGTSLRDSMMPLPYKEPSTVLFQLLTNLVDEARRFASVADSKISDMSSQTPVGTTLAVLERTLKVMSSIQARVHYAMKEELRLLRDIIRDYSPEDYEYDPEEGDRKAKKSDYNLVEIIPVSDPNCATMAQKIAQYQAVIQLSQGAPQIYNMPLLHRQVLEVLGIKNANKLIALPDEAEPMDPVTENMNVLNNKPLKAFIDQDHQSHIAVHTSFMNDPNMQQKVQELSQANPQLGQQLGSAITAHIMEHLAFQYRQEMQEMMQVQLPAPESEEDEDDMAKQQQSDPQMDAQIAQQAAQAADQLLNRNKTAQAAEQAQQAANDPLVQMQQQDMQIKQQEQQRKATKDQMDYDIAIKKLAIEQEKAVADMELQGTKLGLEIAKAKAEGNDGSAEFERAKHEQQMQLEREKHQGKTDLEREKLMTKAQFDREKHQYQMHMDQERHHSQMAQAEQDRSMKYDMEGQKLNAQITRDAQAAKQDMLDSANPMFMQPQMPPGQDQGQAPIPPGQDQGQQNQSQEQDQNQEQQGQDQNQQGQNQQQPQQSQQQPQAPAPQPQQQPQAPAPQPQQQPNQGGK